MAAIHPNSEFVIFVTHIKAEHQYLKIWGQIDKTSATYIERLILPLFEKFSVGTGYPELQEGLSINALCCARFQNDGYYRARVCNICPDGKVVLQFIDYGNIEILPQHEVYLLRNIPGSETLQSFPPVAYEFTLANVAPITNVWDNKTIDTIKKILRYNEYKARCLSNIGNHTFIKLYYNNEDFGELLVKRHMALDATMPDLFRLRHMQHMSPYQMQDRRMINDNCVRAQTNMNSAYHTIQSQGTWHNVPTSYVQSQKLVSHPPVQEALVFKSRVLEVGSKYQVYVSYVEDGPQKFSIQIQNTSELLSKLMEDINSHPTEPLQEPPLPGSVCLGRYSLDKILCRAVVMAVMENKCKLYYVDFGHSEILPYTDIFQLPPQYINPKVLSIRFTLSGVKELNVTSEMSDYFKKIVSGKLLILHVRPPEGPPLIQYGDLYDNDKNIKDILRQAFAVPRTISNVIEYQELKQLSKGTEKNVHVSFVETVNKFFIQLDDNEKSLDSIMIYLAEYVKSATSLHPNLISVGAPCAALYDSQWYRAKILSIDENKIKVLYVDYGNENIVTAESLRTIHNDLVTKLPAQAIKCMLRGHETLPVNNDECSNQFEMLILDKSLLMKIIDVLPDCLIIDLFNPEIRDDIKNQLQQYFYAEKNMNIKSNSHESEHQNSKKIQRSYPKTSLNLEPQVKDKSKNIKEIRDNASKGNNTDKEDSIKNIPSDNNYDHIKSKSWRNDLNGERQDNRYEKSNSFHDSSRNDRFGKESFRNKLTKDEPYNRRNYNDNNSFNKIGKDSRSRGRFIGNDSRFNRSSGFDKNWSDKDSDSSIKTNNRRGRGNSSTRYGLREKPRTEGVSARLHNSRWNDNNSDKGGKINNQYNQKIHSKDKGNYKNNVISNNKESSSESKNTSTNLELTNGNVNIMQDDGILKATKLLSENIKIPTLNVTFGSVKTCIAVFINSPTNFYIQLNPEYFELDILMTNIASIYENDGDTLKHSELKLEKYCIAQYSEDLKWYRAIIKSIEKEQAVVQFIDYGNIESVNLDKIKAIKEEFLKLPIQAINCKLFGINNKIWDFNSVESFTNTVDGKDLEVEFIMKENNTYEVMLREIIDNVPESKYINENFVDGTDIMKMKEEVLNPVKQIDTTEESNKYDYVPFNSKWTMEQIELGSCKDVIITWFINPNNFYCQRLDNELKFRNMMNEIQKLYVNRKSITHKPQVGSSVIAIFSEDKALYRAEIIESKNDDYIVQYIDFGNRSLVNKNNIYQVERKLMELPKQAYHCSMQNIKPFVNSKWSEVNTQEIDNCFNADKYKCSFHNIENNKYIVSLNNSEQDVGYTLVHKNLASYVIVDATMPVDDKSTIELEKQLKIKEIDINLLNGQTLKVKVCNVESASKFHIELSSCMDDSDYKSQPIECCLFNALTFETNKNWKKMIENKELIIYVEEVNNNRLIVKLYDLMGNKIQSEKNLDEKISPIIPMPILNETYKVIISYADHSGSIWLQRYIDVEKDIQLGNALKQHYSNFEKISKPDINMLYAVKSQDGYWNRAKIIKFTNKSVYVNFIDYGNSQEINNELLMELDQQFYVPHQLAINASLTVTLNGTPFEQTNILQEQLSNRYVTAKFFNVNKKWVVELFDDKEKISDRFRSMNLVKTLAENELENSHLIVNHKYNVTVSHIDSPSQFWIQLKDEAEILKQKQSELQTYINGCPLLNGILEEGSLCAAVYSIDNMWYRAEVLDADEDITTVRFIDYGKTDVIDNKSNTIRELTDNLKSIKRFSTKSRLDIIPVDSEDWSEATCNRFNNLVMTNDSLEALIIADSIPKRVELFVNGKSISEILIEENIAVRIYAEQDLINEIIELELDPHSAFVSHINSPSEFWVQEEKSISDLEVMSDRFMVADMFPKVDEIIENLLCVAKYPDDEQWYRARVISHNNGETEVLYIDYGNSAVSTEIRTIPEDLVKIAPLSRRCCLVLPEGITEWSNEACQEFIKLAADGATIFLLDVLKEQETSLVKLTLNDKNVADLLAVFCEQRIKNIEERLPPLGEENSPNVVVSHVNTPAEFWIQAESSMAELEIMSDRLQHAPSFLPLTDLENGTICAAKYPEDEQWYRAQILSQDENGVNVLYIDYGNTSIITELRLLPEDIVNIPILSKRCALQIPDYISSWSEEACQTFKDLAADGATMFQFEVIDNEDPMHVKLSMYGQDITEILLPWCKSADGKPEERIIEEQIINSNMGSDTELNNSKENPDKLNKKEQEPTDTIIDSIDENNSTELLEQEHADECNTSSEKEENLCSSLKELSIDDIIQNMIDNETEVIMDVENIDNTTKLSSENSITQEVSKVNNNSDVNCDLILNNADDLRKDNEDTEGSIKSSIINNDNSNDELLDKESIKCSSNALVSDETLKDLGTDEATMFKLEVIDNKDPVHVKLSMDATNTTEILLPLCKSADSKPEDHIVEEQIINNNMGSDTELNNPKENPDKLNKEGQESSDTIIDSIDENNSTELVEQEHADECNTSSEKEAKLCSSLKELSIDDTIHNTIDKETKVIMDTENIDNTTKLSSENSIKQEISKINNNSDVNCDLILNNADDLRKDNEDTKESIKSSIINTDNNNDELLKQDQTKCSSNASISDKSDLKVIEITEKISDEKSPEKEKITSTSHTSIPKEESIDIKVVNDEINKSTIIKEDKIISSLDISNSEISETSMVADSSSKLDSKDTNV